MDIYFTFIFKNLLLFLKFIFDCSGSCPWAFSVAAGGGWGCTLLRGVRASGCGGFSCCGGQALELGLGSCDTWA